LNKSIILIGGNGHAKVVSEILDDLKLKINIIVAPFIDQGFAGFKGIKQLKNDQEVLKLSPDKHILVNGIGSLPGNNLRKKLYDKFKINGYNFLKLVSPHSIISQSVKLAEGVQVMPGVIINSDSCIGENSIINSGSIIEHDCIIGDHNHVAPGATICGGVKTGSSVHIGVGASVIQQIKIGDNSVVGAGATLTRNLQKYQIIYSERFHTSSLKHDK